MPTALLVLRVALVAVGLGLLLAGYFAILGRAWQESKNLGCLMLFLPLGFLAVIAYGLLHHEDHGRHLVWLGLGSALWVAAAGVRGLVG